MWCASAAVLHAVFRSGNELIFTHSLVRLLVVLSRSGVVWCSFFFPLSFQSVYLMFEVLSKKLSRKNKFL